MGTKGCLCCSGSRKIRRGLWSPDEDAKLEEYIQANGIKAWTLLSIEAGLQRCGKSCRLRWLNYLRPNLKRGKFSVEEQQLIVRLQSCIGNRWSFIAKQLPGRTYNEIKNFWNAKFKGIHNVQEISKIKVPNSKHKAKLDSASLAQDGATSSFSSILHCSKKDNTRIPLFSSWWTDSDHSDTYHVPQHTESMSHINSETLLYDQQHVQYDDSCGLEDVSDMLSSYWTTQRVASISGYDLTEDLWQWTDPVMADMDWSNLNFCS